MAIGSLTIDLNARLANIERDMGRAAHIAEQNGQRIQAAFGKAGTAITGMVGALGVGALAGFVKSGIDAADAMLDLSERTGVAVETLSGLRLAAELSDTSLEAIGNGLNKLAIYIGEADEGNQKYAATLKALGITARDPEQALIQLADAVGRMPDQAQRAAVLNGILGKSWQELVPLLNQGGDGLRRLVDEGNKLSPITRDMAEQAAKFNDALATMKLSANGLGTELGSRMLPGLNAITQAMLEAARQGGVLNAVWVGLGGLGAAMFTDEFATAADKMKRLQGDLRDLQSQASKPSMFGTADIQLLLGASGNTLAQQIEAKKREIAALQKQMDEMARKDGEAAKAAANKASEAAKASPAGRVKSAAADPLASLLGQTDAAVIADVSNKLVLLDARWQAGKIGAEQYAQAVEILNARLAALNGTGPIDVFGNGSFQAADPATVEMIRRQQEAINALNAEMASDEARAAEDYAARLAGLVADTDLAKTERLLADVEFLDQAFFSGKVGAEQYAQAVALITGKSKDAAEASDIIAEAWKNAGQEMEQAMADFLFDPFEQGLDGMLLGFVEMLQKMAAHALAANIMNELFGPKKDGTWDVFGAIAGLFGGAKAEGGPLQTGKWYIAGEHGPEPIWGGGAGAFAVGYKDQASLANQGGAQNVRVVLVDDQRRVGDYLASSAGERVIVNVIRRNAGAIRAAMT